MKNKFVKKLIATTMIWSFVFTYTTPAVLAAGTPKIRSEQAITTLDVNSEDQIHNANSMVNLSLRDADIKQVLRMFADQAGMNVIFAPSVSGTVTMDLVNVTLLKALNLVTSTQKIKYNIKANTLIFSGSGEGADDDIEIQADNKDMILIPVKYVSAASIAEFLNKNIFSKNGINPGVSKKPVVTVNPANNELIIMGTRDDAVLAQKIVEQFDKKPPITNFKVNHVTPAEMAGLICSTLIPSFMSNGSGGDNGGGSSSGGGAATGGAAKGGAAGIPTGFASDDAASSDSSSSGSNGISIGGGKMLCSVDQKTDTEDMESIPFKNLTVSYFPTIGTVQIIGGSPSQLEVIKDYIASNDIKSPQAYLEVQIISLSEQGSKEFSNTWMYYSKNLTFNAANGTLQQGKHPIFFSGHGFTDDVLGNETSNTTTGGTTTNTSPSYSRWTGGSQLVWQIKYMIENSKGRVLANPRILLTSGQQSVIDLTSDYIAKTTSQYLDSTGTGSSQVQKDYDIQSDNGIKVTITPFISPDGYVTLDIKPEYATIAERLTTTSETGDTDIAATLLQRRNLDLKGVRIKDGETLIIGGLIQETETKTVNKIPFLGDLPFIGMFFRSTIASKQKEEMIIMLTPEILVDTEDAANDETTDL